MYQEKIIKAVEIMQGLLNEEDISALQKNKEEAEKALHDCEVIKLPIIGTFNAGKTTLINSLLGTDGTLPVNIVPETAIPCELYPLKPGEEPHVEIYRGEKIIFNGNINEYGSIKVEPGDYGKVFTTSPLVKTWSDKGIIIVDMPGYDSGIEEHNRAIARYMSKGTVFAFLMNCTHGSLRASELSLLKEVCQYGIQLGLFLTFTDLQTPPQTKEVLDYVRFQTDSFLPKGTTVGTLSVLEGDNHAFVDFVNDLSVSDIIQEKSKPIASAFLSTQIATLQGLIALAESGKSQEEIDLKIKDLTDQINNIEKSIQAGLTRADSPEKSTQDILDIVREAIKGNAVILADAIMQSGEDGLSSVNETLISIIRPALAKAFQSEQQQYIEALNADISTLTRHILDGIEIPTNIIEDIIKNNETAIVGYIQYVADMLQNSNHPVARIIGTVLSFFAHFIPDLLRSIFGGQDKARAKLVVNIQGPICDAIVQGLRNPVEEQVRAQQYHIIDAARAQYEANINRMKDMLTQLYNEKASGTATITEQLNNYKNALSQLEEIKNGL